MKKDHLYELLKQGLAPAKHVRWPVVHFEGGGAAGDGGAAAGDGGAAAGDGGAAAGDGGIGGTAGSGNSGGDNGADSSSSDSSSSDSSSGPSGAAGGDGGGGSNDPGKRARPGDAVKFLIPAGGIPRYTGKTLLEQVQNANPALPRDQAGVLANALYNAGVKDLNTTQAYGYADSKILVRDADDTHAAIYRAPTAADINTDYDTDLFSAEGTPISSALEFGNDWHGGLNIGANGVIAPTVYYYKPEEHTGGVFGGLIDVIKDNIVPILALAAFIAGAPYLEGLIAGMGEAGAAAALTDTAVITAETATAAAQAGVITAAEAATVSEVAATAAATAGGATAAAVEAGVLTAGQTAAMVDSLTAAGYATSVYPTATLTSIMANPGLALGNAIGGAAGIQISPAISTAIGNTLIETARNGGDIESALKSAGTSYGLNLAGSEIAKAVGSVVGDIPGLDAAQKTALSSGIANATVAAAVGKDPLASLAASATNYLVPALANQIPGYADLPAEAKKVATAAMMAELAGKSPTDAAINTALQLGKQALVAYGDKTLGISDTAKKAFNDIKASITTPADTTQAQNDITDFVNAVNTASESGTPTSMADGVQTAGIGTGTSTDAGPAGGSPLQNLRAGETATGTRTETEHDATTNTDITTKRTTVQGTTSDGKPYNYDIIYDTGTGAYSYEHSSGGDPANLGAGATVISSMTPPSFETPATDGAAGSPSEKPTDTSLSYTDTQLLADALAHKDSPAGTAGGAPTSISSVVQKDFNDLVASGMGPSDALKLSMSNNAPAATGGNGALTGGGTALPGGNGALTGGNGALTGGAGTGGAGSETPLTPLEPVNIPPIPVIPEVTPVVVPPVTVPPIKIPTTNLPTTTTTTTGGGNAGNLPAFTDPIAPVGKYQTVGKMENKMSQQKLQQLYGGLTDAPSASSDYNYVNDVNPTEVDVRKMEQLPDSQPYYAMGGLVQHFADGDQPVDTSTSDIMKSLKSLGDLGSDQKQPRHDVRAVGAMGGTYSPKVMPQLAALLRSRGMTLAEGGQPGDQDHPNYDGTPVFRTGGLEGLGGKYVEGKGDGTSDDIRAMLANGEYVFSADVVSALGNGSNKAGADRLGEMVEAIRQRARSAPADKLPPDAKSPLEYLKSPKGKKHV